MLYRSLSGPTALAALMALSVAGPSLAQSGGAIEEIIVTAQKRQESAQSVPISISAFDADALDRALIENGQDIQFSVPNTMLVANDRFTMRGIGNNALSATSDNGVGLLFNTSAIGFAPQNEYYDIGRIEVLRGPQGTLYGRNTTGGAINIIPQSPSDEFEGNLSVQIGNFNAQRVQGAINLPLGDNVRQRFAGYSLKRDGYTDNLHTGHAIDSRDQWGIRSYTSIDLSERTTVNLVVDYYEEDSTRTRESKRMCKADVVHGCSPYELGFDIPDSTANIFQSFLSGFVAEFPAGGDIYAGVVDPQDLRAVNTDIDPSYDGDQLLGTLEFIHEFDNHTLTAVTGYAKGDWYGATDYDSAVLPFRFDTPVTYRINRDEVVTTDELISTDAFAAGHDMWTQEVRLASNLDGHFNYTVGAFYMSRESYGTFFIYHPGLELTAKAWGWTDPNSWYLDSGSTAWTDAWAIFGEGYFDVSDRTTVTAGLRYTNEEKSTTTRSFAITPVVSSNTGENDWQEVTGKISIDHQAELSFTDQTLFYGTVSRGYKGGGLSAGNVANPSFDPEYVNAVEIGMKNLAGNGRWRANFAAFYYDYDGLQLSQRMDVGVSITNADATISGFEAEFEFSPSENFLFDLNVSLLNAEIGEFMSIDGNNPAQSALVRTPNVLVDLEGNKLPFSPDASIQFGAQYMAPVSDNWDSVMRVDFSWQDDYFARAFNTSNDAIDSWQVVNAQLRFINEDRGLGVQFFVKNIADEDHIVGSITEDFIVGNYRNLRLLEPRTYGITVEFDF